MRSINIKKGLKKARNLDDDDVLQVADFVLRDLLHAILNDKQSIKAIIEHLDETILSRGRLQGWCPVKKSFYLNVLIDTINYLEYPNRFYSTAERMKNPKIHNDKQ